MFSRIDAENTQASRDDSQLAPQVILIKLSDVDPINGDHARIDLIETGQQIDDGGFAGTCRADERNRLARPGGKETSFRIGTPSL